MTLEIVDAHHHLWDPDVGEYPWMTGAYAPLRRRVDLWELRPHLRANNVVGTIVVQVRADSAETVDLLELASRTAEIRGVVGWIDLTAPNIGDQIDALRAGVGGNRLVGLRHAATDESDPMWLCQPSVHRAMEVLADRELAFDLEITCRELPAAAALVAHHPGVRFVVDHGAKPPIAAGWSALWAQQISDIAQFSHVWCKLSGLVTEASWTDWTPSDLKPFLDHLLETFGAGRLMFGSDWPVCELAAGYRDVVAVAIDALSGCSAAERRSVLSRNAVQFYRLPAITTQGELS